MPPLPLSAQRDQADLYIVPVTPVHYITERIQPGLEAPEYLSTLLVVVQVGGNPGDIDTTNLGGNIGEKSDTELSYPLPLLRGVTPQVGFCQFKPVSMNFDLKVR